MTTNNHPKPNKFISRIKDYSRLNSSTRFEIAVYYHTEVLGNNIASIHDIKEFYAIVGLLVPANFGGEVRQLNKSRRIIKSGLGYKLAIKSKNRIKSMVNNSRSVPAGDNQQPPMTIATISIDDLHKTIKTVSRQLYLDGHYSSAIFEAYKAVVNAVRQVSGLHVDGKPLMDQAFSVNKPIIYLNDQKTQSDKDEQLGFMLLYGGATLGIRNPKAHDNVVQNDPRRALEYLSFASLLMERLDERLKP